MIEGLITIIIALCLVGIILYGIIVGWQAHQEEYQQYHQQDHQQDHQKETNTTGCNDPFYWMVMGDSTNTRPPEQSGQSGQLDGNNGDLDYMDYDNFYDIADF